MAGDIGIEGDRVHLHWAIEQLNRNTPRSRINEVNCGDAVQVFPLSRVTFISPLANVRGDHMSGSCRSTPNTVGMSMCPGPGRNAPKLPRPARSARATDA